ncbi:MAG: sigma-70 family RNA polymerase sigma factor [Oligoflexia bacterium]|nr:sigma-70 family RNA polymerase sigma factor [Oligoflexia bacterium]
MSVEAVEGRDAGIARSEVALRQTRTLIQQDKCNSVVYKVVGEEVGIAEERADDRQAEKLWIESALRGDKNAYRALVERYQQRVFCVALEITRSREDAEDVAQETFVKAYLSLKDFKGESSFYTWLYRIAFNMAVDVKRKIGRRGGQAVEFDERQVGTTVETMGSSAPTPDVALQNREELKQLASALRDLSEEHRIVMTLREIDGLSYDEIADVLGISKGTVMSRLHYARKRLQSALMQQGVSGSEDESGARSESMILNAKGKEVLL